MFIGASLWLIGFRFGLFDRIGHFAFDHGLLNFVILSGFMGLGALIATIRKSAVLRKAVAARASAEVAAAASARHDSLTGLSNRRFFYETLEEALAQVASGKNYAVMVIDLDKFKPVNDLHGHGAGNAVLCTVAERLMNLASDGSAVARLGGDEFAVLCPYSGDQLVLSALAQRIIVAIQQPIAWNQGHVEVSCTIGIVVTTTERSDIDALMHAADVAMYQGKRGGRGMFCFFQAEMHAAVRARAQMELDLREAITNKRIVPHFQPIVALPSKSIVGFEVLARWEQPNRGPIAPDVFIRVAEETGMIGELYYGVLRRACADALNWPAHLSLSVNISPTQLQDPLLPVKTLGILTETGFPPQRLEVEITEAALINDLVAARAALMSLQNLGVKIALDDFGTGYSSLYHLRELRFDKLKIDRSYVTALRQGSDDATMVDAIIQLGASLSLQTTAEGIETETNLEWLSKRGCSFGQGYLFGRPVNGEDAARLANDEAKDSLAA